MVITPSTTKVKYAFRGEQVEDISVQKLLKQPKTLSKLNEQQKKRKAQVQFEAQHYINEDWDLIRAKIEANAELSKSMLGSELQGEDFAKKMVDLVESLCTNKFLKPHKLFEKIWRRASDKDYPKRTERLMKQDDEPTKKSGKRRNRWQGEECNTT
ncbi:hypothetical protein Tco_0400255 [Tanacetum coccineum]